MYAWLVLLSDYRWLQVDPDRGKKGGFNSMNNGTNIFVKRRRECAERAGNTECTVVHAPEACRETGLYIVRKTDRSV